MFPTVYPFNFTAKENVMNIISFALDDRILEYDVDHVVADVRSKYQRVQILNTLNFGNLLLLDELQSESQQSELWQSPSSRRITEWVSTITKNKNTVNIFFNTTIRFSGRTS